MALKKNFQTLDTFSMSSMTDVIFLLLIFFMVTSTIIFPTAIDVNLPQSSEQTTTKPVTEIYLDGESKLWLVIDRHDSIPENATPRSVTKDELFANLMLLQHADSLRTIALYADSVVPYARVIDILDIASRNKLHVVLATRGRQE